MATTKDSLPQELDEIRVALRDPEVRLRLVQTMSHGRGVQVYVKTRKIGPLILPSESQTLSDILAMIGTLAEED